MTGEAIAAIHRAESEWQSSLPASLASASVLQSHTTLIPHHSVRRRGKPCASDAPVVFMERDGSHDSEAHMRRDGYDGREPLV